MSSASEIQSLAMKLPERSRLKLANELLRSVKPAISSESALEEASRRETEIESGEVELLDEKEFWSGIKRCDFGKK